MVSLPSTQQDFHRLVWPCLIVTFVDHEPCVIISFWLFFSPCSCPCNPSAPIFETSVYFSRFLWSFVISHCHSWKLQLEVSRFSIKDIIDGHLKKMSLSYLAWIPLSLDVQIPPNSILISSHDSCVHIQSVLT